jgi:tRNA-Thr(GGU) m(6)t(6)A37 methyltransferase TsaA
MHTLELEPIGVVRSPFLEPAGTPIQPCYADGVEGTVHVRDDIASALDDLDGFDRIWLVYWLHRAGPFRPHVVPYRDVTERGLFATRSPTRPCPIGLSVVRLLGLEGTVLRVSGIDVIDGTPLLDIKPYVPEFDCHPGSAAGWLDRVGADRRVADGRFHGGK